VWGFCVDVGRASGGTFILNGISTMEVGKGRAEVYPAGKEKRNRFKSNLGC